MERHVFRMDIIGTVMGSTIMLVFTGMVIYNLVATQNYLNIILIIIPLLFFLLLYKRRIVIENCILYYKKEQVNLESVTTVVSDNISQITHLGARTDEHLFLLDKENNVLVHFDKDYVKGRKQEKFIKVVKSVNPNVKIEI